MKERPILFSSPMVRAILDGRKTQTRRVVKPWDPGYCVSGPRALPDDFSMLPDGTSFRATCPYGIPGDCLWVRETCRAEELMSGLDGVRYIDDDAFRPIENDRIAADRWMELNSYRGRKGATVPAIHMPRWASRITLEITNARVERLQEISEEDAIAEGARYFDDIPMATLSHRLNRWSMESPENTDQCLSTARWAFANYFCKVNSKRPFDFAPWEANPWVWVVEFKRIEHMAEINSAWATFEKERGLTA